MEYTVENNYPETFLEPEAGYRVVTIYTQPLREIRFKQFCDNFGIPCYLPLKRVWRFHNVISKDRNYNYRKETLKPMFPSYVFVHVHPDNQLKIWHSNHIVRFCDTKLSDNSRLMNEIAIVRKFELIGMKEELIINPGIEVGDSFVIESGIWKGCCGKLVKKEKKFYWLVNIESTNGILAATINPSEYIMRPTDKD